MKESLQERINRYIAELDEYEAIGLIEDELEDITERIFNEMGYGEQTIMQGNGILLCKLKNGYLIKTDEDELMYIDENNYKGNYNGRGTRIQFGKTSILNGRTFCLDAIECVNYQELKYRMFSYIEDRNMSKAATMAWAIYNEASDEDKQDMRICIHALRRYVKALKQSAA